MSPRQIRGYYCEIIASRKDVRMKATEARLLDFLKRSQQFVITIINGLIHGQNNNVGNFGTTSFVPESVTIYQRILSVRLFILSRGCIRFLVFLRYWSLMVNKG